MLNLWTGGVGREQTSKAEWPPRCRHRSPRTPDSVRLSLAFWGRSHPLLSRPSCCCLGGAGFAESPLPKEQHPRGVTAAREPQGAGLLVATPGSLPGCKEQAARGQGGAGTAETVPRAAAGACLEVGGAPRLKPAGPRPRPPSAAARRHLHPRDVRSSGLLRMFSRGGPSMATPLHSPGSTKLVTSSQ